MVSPQQDRIDAQIARLTALSLRQVEAQVTEKRLRWLAEHDRPVHSHPTPRTAFEALFFEYMGLAPDDLAVLREDEDAIVWRSTNPCPTLDACRRLGLDTRVVCRGAYEKSTQAFVSRIDPELRFLRDYHAIRPWQPYCEERIVRVDFAAMMRIAIQEAKRSRAEGNKGYGAVVGLGEQVIATAHDTAVTDRDPSRHAEANAIRAAAAQLDDADLCGCLLFSTCEPCPMCSSMAVWANVSAVVFGASIDATAARGKARITIPAAEVIARSPALVEVYPGVLGAECTELY